MAVLSERVADVHIVTEGCAGLLPAVGHIVDAGCDWGYGDNEDRRKVLMWSRCPWFDVVRMDTGPGRGRIVSGRTSTSIGELTVVGVCIPWAAAHVTTGRRDAHRWDEHIACCIQLEEVAIGSHSVLVGDFNQTIPRIRQPIKATAALDKLLSQWTVWTGGSHTFGPLIDHIATSDDLVAADIECSPASDVAGRLSDHVGVSCTLSWAYDERPRPL